MVLGSGSPNKLKQAYVIHQDAVLEVGISSLPSKHSQPARYKTLLSIGEITMINQLLSFVRCEQSVKLKRFSPLV